MTSNLGADKIIKERKLGFGNEDTNENNKTIMNELKREFKPEFINRIDNIIIFNKLNNKDLIKIIDIILENVQERLLDKNIELEVSGSVKKYIVENEIDLNYGARQLKRKIQEIIENKIASEIVEGKLKENNKIEFYLDDNKIQSKIIT